MQEFRMWNCITTSPPRVLDSRTPDVTLIVLTVDGAATPRRRRKLASVLHCAVSEFAIAVHWLWFDKNV
jgi:hypothetical protein